MINNIDELKGKISLLDLVNENVITKRSGQNHVGLCPFHDDSSPSFSVDPEQNVFYCFGCQEGGDAIHYFQKLNNLDFLEAVTQLADKYGVTLDKDQTEKQKQFASKQEIAYKLIGDINRQFQAQLNGKVKDYLTKREISDNTIKTFGIGYGGSVKIDNKEIARELGILKRDKQTSQDKFVYQDRLIVPIRDKKGLTVAFNARTLTNQEPKYIHSPNSYLWQKKETLFGLSESFPLIKKQDKVYIVEGCFDVFMAWQNNIPAVACLGSAMSKKQLTELLKLTNNIIFCLDEDKAGQKAIHRLIESVETEVLAGVFHPKILTLSNKDIADYFLENEVEDFLSLTPIDWVQWLFEYYTKTEDNPVLSVTKLISKFNLLGEKQKYIRLASEVLEGEQKYLERELSRALHKPLTENIKIQNKKEILSIPEMQRLFKEKKQRREDYVNRQRNKRNCVETN
jgi:DNA primase